MWKTRLLKNHSTKDAEMETWEWICCHPCLTWGHASQASISSCCDGGFAVPRKKERKNKKEELSGTARSLLSCARSQKCHRVIEWSSAGSCKSEKGDSPPSVGGKVNQSCFMSGLGLCSSLKWVSSPHFGRSAKKNKNIQAGGDREEDKGGSLSAAVTRCGCLSRQASLPCEATKEKHSPRIQSVAVSASARKWIHVICPLPGGTELLRAGLSILAEPLYPISTLSQPIQLLLLIAFFHLPLSLTLHPSHCASFGEAISAQQCISEVPPVLDPHLLLPVCVCSPVCACVWISNAGWHCVCRGKGQNLFLTFCGFWKKTKNGWIPVGSERVYRRRTSGTSQHLDQQSFKAPRSRR